MSQALDLSGMWERIERGEPTPEDLATVKAAVSERDDLAMLVRMLVGEVKRTRPDSPTAAKAVDYLVRKSLQGSPLR